MIEPKYGENIVVLFKSVMLFHNREKVVKNFISDSAKKLFASLPKLG